MDPRKYISRTIATSTSVAIITNAGTVTTSKLDRTESALTASHGNKLDVSVAVTAAPNERGPSPTLSSIHHVVVSQETEHMITGAVPTAEPTGDGGIGMVSCSTVARGGYRICERGGGGHYILHAAGGSA